MMKCRDIRNQLEVGDMCCLSPIEQGELGFKVMKLVTFRGVEIHMDFLEREEDLRLYFSEDGYYLYKGRRCKWIGECPPSLIMIIKNVSKNTQILLLHSVFCLMMRLFRVATSASAADAVAAAVDAAYAAAYAGAVAVAPVVHASAADAADAAARKAFKELIDFRKKSRK